MFQNESRTEIGDLGEFGLIEHLTKSVKINHKETIIGIGDDAAQVNINGDVLISTDMLVEGVHFDLSYAPLRHLGYKAITSNLSDICAMNTLPTHVLVSVAISNRFSVEALEELYAGMKLACERYHVDFVGGDTTSSLNGLVISVTAFGKASEHTIKRSGAKENELIVVSGDLGGAYMGLQLLEREKAVFKDNPSVQPDLEGNDYILERQLKPEARVDVVIMLNDMGIVPTSMMDISDGLASELFHLCKHSNTGCAIYEDKLPIDPTTHSTAREFELDPTMCALNGGEDYELLFTIKQDDFDKIKGKLDFTIIGHMTDKNSGLNLITKNDHVEPITAQGWEHFREEKPESGKKEAEE